MTSLGPLPDVPDHATIRHSMTDSRAPSEEAIALLRDQARQLDVEDLVDLCYARTSDSLRTAVYLESLRGRPGEQAQVAACLLCFDLARRGDERREAELQFLLPTLDHLFSSALSAGKPPLAVLALLEKSEAIAELWAALADHAARQDPRLKDILPNLDTGEVIEIDLFGSDELAEIEVGFDDFDIDIAVDEAAVAAFDDGFNRLLPAMPAMLFSSESGSDLDRLERLRDHCESFASRVPIAAELRAMTSLYLATHTRAAGLFGRRNKRRDRALLDGLTAFLALPEPPSSSAAWFARSDLPGAEPYAWEKMAELLLDVAAMVGEEEDAARPGLPAALGAQAGSATKTSADEWAAAVATRYGAHERSATVPTRLAVSGERRRRR